MGHERLAGPHPARPRARRFLDPVAGWFRRLEREVSLALSHRVFSRVPGMWMAYGWQLRRQLTVSEAEVALAGLPAPFHGARVLLVTDVHAGPFLSPRQILRAFQRLASLSPDVVLLGGDFATSRVAELEGAREAFRALRAPLGVYAVLGNHDHYAGDPPRLRRVLESAGVTVLHNRAVGLDRAGERLVLAGIDDYNAGRPDLDAALRSAGSLRGDAGSPILLLSHNPDVFFEAAERGVALTLAGHTHGGQIRVPGLPVLVRMSRYRLDHGRYSFRGAELVVSRGLGVSGLPVRLACSPEAVLLTLRPA